MISVRRAKERRFDRHPGYEVWLTFNPDDRADPIAEGFGAIGLLDEFLLPPGATIKLLPVRDAEVLTYVHEGRIGYRDSMHRSGVLLAGELQRMTTGSGIHQFLSNSSRSGSAHVLRILLRHKQAVREPGYEKKLFTEAACRGRLCVVASPNARSEALRIHQDALIHRTVLDVGQHLVYALLPGRGAWIHILQGEVNISDFILTAGDGAGVRGELVVSLTAQTQASLLLLDVQEQAPELPKLTNTAFFRMLWDQLVEVLGAAATATIVSRATRRALPRNRELAGLTVLRVEGEYRCTVPPAFDLADGPAGPLADLLDEIRPLLVELTGAVVLRRLGQIPELKEWATAA